MPRSIQDPLTATPQRDRHAQRAARRARRGRAAGRFASSSSVYGANPELPKREDMPTLPISPYAVAKLAAEGYCRAFHSVYGLETVALRYFNVFGPRQDPLSQYAAVIPKFITALLDGRAADDLRRRRAVARLHLHRQRGRRERARGDGRGRRRRGVQHRLRREHHPERAGRGNPSARWERVQAEHAEPRAGDVRDSLADISRAREALGYEPSVDVSTGLRRTFEWYAARRAAPVA